jgi:hypothetical protein
MSRSTSKPTPKYRPVLTATQILHILALAKTELPIISDNSYSLIATLSPFQAKIENGGIQAAYIEQETRPKVNSLEALGVPTTNPTLNNSNANATKEEYWEACYTKFTLSPTLCSLDEIAGSNEHKYLNDLMTDAELEAFEERL